VFDADHPATGSIFHAAQQLVLVQRVMERQTPTNIIFLDACRNNPLARNLARAMGTRSAQIGAGLAAVESGVGTLISFSTQPSNVATDGRGATLRLPELLPNRLRPQQRVLAISSLPFVTTS